jgi:hypothetical protein
MRTKKIKNPAKLFGPSAMPSTIPVGIRADGHVSSMRGPSVLNVGNSVGIRADGHLSGMRGPLVMPSVVNIGNSVGIRADRHVSGMRGPSVFNVGNSVGIRIGKAVGNPSVSVAKSRNFFATLCEIPTGYMPSVLESEKPSVILRKSVGECGKIP